MAINRSSSAHWEGDLKNGNGRFTLGSGAFSGPYTFATRFESGDNGTNPEDLIAAAHASCFAMAFSNMLAREGYTPDAVDVTATVTLDADAGKITRSHLVCEGRVPGIDDATFQDIGKQAKDGCPISKTLGAVDEITLDATLVG
jgi:osmotically inducible protein OsmC